MHPQVLAAPLDYGLRCGFDPGDNVTCLVNLALSTLRFAVYLTSSWVPLMIVAQLFNASTATRAAACSANPLYM